MLDAIEIEALLEEARRLREGAGEAQCREQAGPSFIDQLAQ